ALNDARMWSANGHHSHGLKQMFMYKQGCKVKFQIWSTILHTAVFKKKIVTNILNLIVRNCSPFKKARISDTPSSPSPLPQP
ncbi:hypothetical protein K443DRAFT_82468, partial [Laccaria amethystina LaAM-08-1]